MKRIIKDVRKNFILTILLVVLSVIGITWGVMQLYNQREIAAPAHISEVNKTSENNEAFAQYLEEQREFEAHFITLASEIKQQESDRVTSALTVTSVAAIGIGIIVALFAARRLMKPVIEAYDSQERFIQDAAHELRNPLAAMTVALQQAQKSGRDDPLVKTFRRQTKRLVNINEDLLFLERTASKKITRTNISELLGDIIEGLQPYASAHQVELDIKSSKDIYKTMSAEDYIRLTKNLIENAIKYSPKHSTVTVRQTIERNAITISVKDQGIGIPKADIDLIGQRFFRASNTGKIDGTGLGLAIVQKVLNLYGGSIKITSTLNKGSTFTVTLPA